MSTSPTKRPRSDESEAQASSIKRAKPVTAGPVDPSHWVDDAMVTSLTEAFPYFYMRPEWKACHVSCKANGNKNATQHKLKLDVRSAEQFNKDFNQYKYAVVQVPATLLSYRNKSVNPAESLLAQLHRKDDGDFNCDYGFSVLADDSDRFKSEQNPHFTAWLNECLPAFKTNVAKKLVEVMRTRKANKSKLHNLQPLMDRWEQLSAGGAVDPEKCYAQFAREKVRVRKLERNHDHYGASVMTFYTPCFERDYSQSDHARQNDKAVDGAKFVRACEQSREHGVLLDFLAGQPDKQQRLREYLNKAYNSGYRLAKIDGIRLGSEPQEGGASGADAKTPHAFELGLKTGVDVVLTLKLNNATVYNGELNLKFVVKQVYFHSHDWRKANSLKSKLGNDSYSTGLYNRSIVIPGAGVSGYSVASPLKRAPKRVSTPLAQPLFAE